MKLLPAGMSPGLGSLFDEVEYQADSDADSEGEEDAVWRLPTTSNDIASFAAFVTDRPGFLETAFEQFGHWLTPGEQAQYSSGDKDAKCVCILALLKRLQKRRFEEVCAEGSVRLSAMDEW